jgi:hypothetical protein
MREKFARRTVRLHYDDSVATGASERPTIYTFFCTSWCHARQAFTNEVKSGMLVRKVGPWTTAENSAEAVAFSD